MKKPFFIVTIIIAFIVSGYVYIRFFLLKTKTDHPILKSQSALDLRPLMINKLDELVKDGSDGLYNLSIKKLEPDIPHSTIDVFNVTLIPDSAVIRKLDSLKKLPDDIFKISFQQLHITNITPTDFLHSQKIDLDTILISNPVIQVYHKNQSYNEEHREKDSTKTLYQKLTQQFKSISIKAIVAENGNFISTDIQKKETKKFNNVSFNINDLVIDSATQYDTSRILFSKEINLSSKNYVSKTSDSLYIFKIDSINVSASKRLMIANNVALLPRGNKQQFEKKLAKVEDRFTIHFPKLVFTNIDWWHLMNNESFTCDIADMYNAEIDDYLNRSLPHSSKITYTDFPSQLLIQIPLKINIKKLNVHNAKVVYEEFAPESEQSGTVYFTAINGIINNITNISSSIKINHKSTASASGLFMKTVPMKGSFMFDLSKKNGTFSADVQIDSMDKTVLNPVTEPLGLVTVKTGTVHNGSAHIEGNNFTATAKVIMLYNDLRLIPLKKDIDKDELKKRPLLSFLANTFVIKKDNPRGNNPPDSAQVNMERGTHGNFFNFVWSTVRKGILKSIGVPQK